MQEQSSSRLSSSVRSPALRRRLSAIFRLVARWFCVRCRKLLAWRKGYAQSHYLPMESTPFLLLQECRSDLRTALNRMARRVDKLPFFWTLPIGPCYQLARNGSWEPNTRTLACIADMQSFESQFPTATNFDWEMFRVGWEAGAKWYDGNRPGINHEEDTCDPPSRIIARSSIPQESTHGPSALLPLQG